MDKLGYLNKLNAELLKTELLAFLSNEGTEEFTDSLVAYIEEDFSRGDCEE